jgi:ABC-type uncharacterized transport system permease subunit
MLLCFYMMAGLTAFMVIVSILTRSKNPIRVEAMDERPAVSMPTGREARWMRLLWLIVAMVMAYIYYAFR